MKKLIILLVLLISVNSFGQDWNKWAVDVEYGIHSVNDESATNNTSTYHLGAGIRYNFNHKLGLGLSGGYDNIHLTDFNDDVYHLDFTRFNIEATLNVLNVLDLHSNWFTLLAHGGPGVSFIRTNNNYKETVMNGIGGVTGLFKVTDRTALKLNFQTVANISQSRTLDGTFKSTNSGITSTMHNVSVGIVYYLGKKNTKHIDWVKSEPRVVNYYSKSVHPTEHVMKTITNVIENKCDCDNTISEFVFFDHDKFVIRDTELNAFYKVYSELIKDDSYTLIIKGYASATSNSNKDNQTLSENRSNTLYKKYIDLGINPNRISFDSFGKDLDKYKLNVHDVARRVELIVVK